MPPKLKLENLEDLKVADLKEHCKKFGLKVSGSKAELTARLKEHLTKNVKNKPEPKATRAGGDNVSQAPLGAPTSSCPGATDSSKEEELAGQHPLKVESSSAPTVSEKPEPPIESDIAIQASASESVDMKLKIESENVSKDAPTTAPEESRMAEESDNTTHAATQDTSVASVETQPAIESEADAHATNVISDEPDQKSMDVEVPEEDSRPAEDGKDSEIKAMTEDDKCKETIAEPSEGVTNEIGDTPEPSKQACALEESALLGEQQVEEQGMVSNVVEEDLANGKGESENPEMDQHFSNGKVEDPAPQRDLEPESKQDHDMGSGDGPGNSTKENQRSDRPKERRSRSPQKQSSSRKRSPSRKKRSPSRRKRSPSRRRRSPSQKRRSPSRRRRRSPSRRRKSPSRRRSRSRRRRSPSRRRRSPSRRRRSPSVRRRNSRSRDRRRR